MPPEPLEDHDCCLIIQRSEGTDVVKNAAVSPYFLINQHQQPNTLIILIIEYSMAAQLAFSKLLLNVHPIYTNVPIFIVFPTKTNMFSHIKFSQEV